MLAFKKKPQATKCSHHCTISLTGHTLKIAAKIFRRRTEMKIEIVIGDQHGFRRGKGTRDVIGMLKVVSERTFEIEEEMCVCFIDWHKAFDRVNWTKLMQILKGTGIDWRKRKLISNLQMAQSIKVRLDRGGTRSVKIGIRVRHVCCLSLVLFKLYSE
jgi:hypothetical protein